MTTLHQQLQNKKRTLTYFFIWIMQPVLHMIHTKPWFVHLHSFGVPQGSIPGHLLFNYIFFATFHVAWSPTRPNDTSRSYTHVIRPNPSLKRQGQLRNTKHSLTHSHKFTSPPPNNRRTNKRTARQKQTTTDRPTNNHQQIQQKSPKRVPVFMCANSPFRKYVENVSCLVILM